MNEYHYRARVAALLSVVLTGLLLAGCQSMRADVDIVDSAATALGGADRIRGVKTFILDAEGQEYQLLQNSSPNSNTDLPRWLLNPYRRGFDLSNGHMRLRRSISVTFPWVLDRVRHQDTGIDAHGVYVVDFDGNLRPVRNAGADLGLDRYHHPLTLLAAALKEGATRKNVRQLEGLSAVDIKVPTGETLTLAIDNKTKLPAFISSMRDQPNLGDLEVRTTFSDYEDVDGFRLPRRMITKWDRFVVNELVVTKHTLNSDPDGFMNTPNTALQEKQIPPDPRLGPIHPKEMAPGVWFLPGNCTVGCDNSIVVEFADHLELIEAPIGDERSANVIKVARSLRPNKPLTKLIVTHHHSDHAGGLRAAISEGLTVVAHESNKWLFEELATRPHTIVPDALARKPMPLHFEPVGDHATFSDSLRTMDIYRVHDDPHADSMIMVHLPKEKILVEGDPYNPSNKVHIWAPNLDRNLKRLKLTVDNILPIHGDPVTAADLQNAVKNGLENLANWW
jgi:glyoxylase-like metal-dependent hydrolase (beta-lactamase superfamily II)